MLPHQKFIENDFELKKIQCELGKLAVYFIYESNYFISSQKSFHILNYIYAEKINYK